MRIAHIVRDHRLITMELIPDRVLTQDLPLLRSRVDGITVPALVRHPEDPSYPSSFNITPQQRSIASALIVQRNGIVSIPSLTCRDFHKTDLPTIPSLLRLGLENLLVLFGDPLPGTAVKKYGYPRTVDLIRDIMSACETWRPCIGAVTNQYSRNREEEVSRTIDKVDAGAEFIVTNVAFDETCVLDHIDNLKGQGLDVPILTQVSIASSLANLHYVSHRFDIPLSSTVLAKMARRDDPHPGRSLAVQTYKVLRDQTDGVHFSYLLRTRNPIPSYHQLLEEIGVGPRVTETILEASKVHIKTNN